MRKWTQKEEDYLRSNTSQSHIEVGKALGRSPDSIERKRNRLGLRKTEQPTKEVTKTSVREDVAKIVEKQKESENAKRVKILASELLKAEKEKDALLGVGKLERLFLDN